MPYAWGPQQRRWSTNVTFATVLLFIHVGALADEIKCFCDRLSCPGSLMCTGKWCLIGISTDENLGGNGRLDQICGWDEADRPMDCAKNWDRWTEVCACDEPLCNTFAHLRSNLDRNPQEDMSLYASADNKKQLNGAGPQQRSRGWSQGGNLIILLVILPLIVGGLAVCLVFINYHCKMN